ncbi:MAG TPA: hypothetical protein VNC22_04875 [Sporichthya sp.]|nr:hypothetical protein [Sporichthya sp.]
MTPAIDARAQWNALTDALAAAADVVLDDPRITSDLVRSEGVQYLTRFLGAANVFEMEADPAYPRLVRVFSPENNWALPCPDGLYLMAPLDGAHTYRVWGRRGTAHLFVTEVFKGGFSDIPHMAVFDSRSEWTLGPDGEIEFVLSQEERPGNWLRIPPGPSVLLLRQWFYDWEKEEQGEFLLERVGARYPAPPVTAEVMEERIARYTKFLRSTSAAFVKSAAQHYAAPADRVPFPRVMAEISEESDNPDAYSMRGQVYGLGHYRCELDEAVLLEVTPPECEYWSFALFSQYWERTDWIGRPTSINGHQAFLGDDGVFRAVIAHQDPGVPNWLDAGHRVVGLIGGRYYGAADVPEPSLRTVKFDELRNALPASTPHITDQVRQDELRRREAALARRYRP